MNKLPPPKFIFNWVRSLVRILVWPTFIFGILLLNVGNVATIIGAHFSPAPVAQAFLSLLQIVIWPATVIWIAFAFQEIVAYLFFSMREFNFFGAKGKLKNIQELINEKANEKYEKKVKDEEIEKKQRATEEELEGIKKSKQTLQERFDDVFKLADRLNSENSELQKKIAEVDTKVEEARNKGMDDAIEIIARKYSLTKKEPETVSSVQSGAVEKP